MAPDEAKPAHLERTATEPRNKPLHTVILRKVDEINDQIRVFRLEIPQGAPPIRFLPGQWLDVFVPGVPQAGGFTVTSTPAEARESTTEASKADATGLSSSSPSSYPYVELAVQRSPENPPAAWLWGSDIATLVGAELRVRIGGSFVWPPPGINIRSLRRVVFVAGGVGINPLVSMVASLAKAKAHPFEVRFLYSLRDSRSPGGNHTGADDDAEGTGGDADRFLFLERLVALFGNGGVKGSLGLYVTGGNAEKADIRADANEETNRGEREDGGSNVITCRNGSSIPFRRRRITVDEVAMAAGDTSSDRRFAVVYVCGVPTMTDEFVRTLTDRDGGFGMEPHRVLCEKWW